MPSISAVLTTRNRPALLLEALASAARQTHLEMELILVRDGGEPLSGHVQDALTKLEFPALLVEHDDPPAGIAASRNQGVSRARGDAVAFLDDDDAWDPGHLAGLAQALDRDPKLEVVYSDVRVLQTSTGATRLLAVPFDLEVFTRDGFIPPSAFAARRAAFDRVGPFDPELATSEDWDWLLRVVRGGGAIARVPGATVTVRIHEGGISHLGPEFLAERLRCLERLRERHQLPPIQPKTFWEVAADLCPGASASTS